MKLPFSLCGKLGEFAYLQGQEHVTTIFVQECRQQSEELTKKGLKQATLKILRQFSTHDFQDQASFFASRNGDETLSCGIGVIDWPKLSWNGWTQQFICHLKQAELRDVSANAVNAIAEHCPDLIGIGFLDCLKVDEVAVGTVVSVLFLLATGTSKMKWRVFSHLWHKN
ncbi:hypothetical protein NC651_030223 [Populus alba x Populus x berolinensis]|nr:hypothetical protein NC651_030223 [Populus alba x Populus x berolinensis]